MTDLVDLDLVLHGGWIADVFRLRAFQGWVGIRDGRFVYVEPGSPPADLKARQVLDVTGQFVAPGLIDAHMHIESSLITPRRFAEAVLPHGTTAVLADPHEIANVAGEEGVWWMIRASRKLPLRIYYAVPSSVPATSPELESTHGVFDSDVVRRLASAPSVIALGEVMDYRGVLAGDERLRKIVEAAHAHGLLVEGHIPDLKGSELSQYLSLGIGSDHTLANPSKILEQISKGVTVMLQTKSLSPENMAVVNALVDRSRILLVTDDFEPALLVRGHLSMVVQAAVNSGMPPLEALSAATLRPAVYLKLRGLGAIAPGYLADFLILDGPTMFPPRRVYVGGQLVASDGVLEVDTLPGPPYPLEAPSVPGPFTPDDFRLVEEGSGVSTVIANAVRVENEVNTLTDLEQVAIELCAGHVVFMPEDDLALVAVFARDGSSHSVGVVKHTGLRAGAFASTFAHDSHNLLVIGRTPQDMATAATAVHEMGGGVAVVQDGKLVAQLPLPIGGILSDAPLDDVVRDQTAIDNALRQLGVCHKRPFLLFSTMALSVSPRFKFSDKGVVDVEKRRIIPTVWNL